jgi:glycosyltransferase involved in cell wall biosynthesis
MKVGVAVQDWVEGDGGAMTFESEIVRCLIASADPKEIELSTLSRSAKSPYNCEHIQTTRPKSGIKAPLHNRILRKLKLQRRLPEPPYQPFNHLDLIYSPSYNGVTATVPFLITCWDLQHRIHPFLPEFSTDLWTWEQRERHYDFWLNRATGIIVGTNQGRDEVATFYGIPEERIHVIPFFASQSLRSVPSTRPTWLPNGPFFFYPAQFWPHKNHITLVKSLEIIHKTTPFRPYLVCTGVDKPAAKGTLPYIRQNAAERGIAPYVMTPGFVPESELRWLYENAVALTFSSLFGPDNLPPIEAMSLGCPVIASRVKGSEQQLSDAALLAPPLCEETFAKQMTGMLENLSLRQTMIAKGLQITQELTVQNYASHILTLLNLYAKYFTTWK